MDDLSGRTAIENALKPLYRDTEGQQWGTLISWTLGGPDPLDPVRVYPRADPVPHWHYISFGMTELDEKESQNPDESGWGFEFTFRLTRRPEEHEAPVWPVGFLQNLARYVYSSGNWFEAGDHVDANGPIFLDRQDSLIRAFAFTADPELGPVDSPNGRFQFLQVVGLTLDEYDAARSWRTQGLLGAVAPHMPLYITDLNRTSMLEHDDVGAAIRTGIARDGSGLGMLYVETASWESSDGCLHLRFSASACPAIADALVNRLPHGRTLTIAGNGRSITFSPSDSGGATLDEGVLTLDVLPAELSALLAALHSISPGPLSIRPQLVIAFDHET